MAARSAPVTQVTIAEGAVQVKAGDVAVSAPPERPRLRVVEKEVLERDPKTGLIKRVRETEKEIEANG